MVGQFAAEALEAMAWVCVEPAPYPHVSASYDTAMYYGNKLLDQFKASDPARPPSRMRFGMRPHANGQLRHNGIHQNHPSPGGREGGREGAAACVGMPL